MRVADNDSDLRNKTSVRDKCVPALPGGGGAHPQTDRLQAQLSTWQLEAPGKQGIGQENASRDERARAARSAATVLSREKRPLQHPPARSPRHEAPDYSLHTICDWTYSSTVVPLVSLRPAQATRRNAR